MRNLFYVKYDEDDCIVLLQNVEDIHQMNWAKGEIPWGTVKLPKGMAVKKRRRITGEGMLEERYIFSNVSKFPVYIKECDLGVYLSLPDSYVDADECMIRHCHTHIWCGGESSWIKAVRMSGIGPHLGMILRNGSLNGYSIERNTEKGSNDRGSFLVHPDIHVLQSGESYEICWEWFWFEQPEIFAEIILNCVTCPLIFLEQSTYFVGEKATLQVRGKGKAKQISVRCNTNEACVWRCEEDESTYTIYIEMSVDTVGDKRIDVVVNGMSTYAVLYGCAALDKLMEARCHFIAEHQQEDKGILKGAYLIYDMETQKRYYSHLDDHNAGRERLAMGTLIALWLQDRSDEKLSNSLNEYIDYVYRELFDEEMGDVFNDAGRNLDWDRLYNYPWMSTFFMEVYKWKKEKRYILNAYKALRRYYEKNGNIFYAIGIQATELIYLLEKAELCREAKEITVLFMEHADHVKKNGLHFPKSEVNYEQSIVAPAVSILLQAYEITRQMEYVEAAREMINVLKLFNGRQPDYHLFENAIRHWDGFWFGKRRCFGDTFPHYWSVLTAVCYTSYSEIINEKKYLQMARASLRGCLNLFDENGNGSCAMVYPKSVNGVAAHYYDPWANDQDWALYYAWKMKEIVL